MSLQLEPWRPWTSMMSSWRDLEDRMDRLFTDMSGRSSHLLSPVELPWLPTVEMFEREGNLVARFDLPGMKREEIKIAATDSTLTVSGERKAEKEVRDTNYYRCERSYGAFQRVLTMPTDVDMTKIKATYRDGVLEIMLPKIKGKEPTVVPIQ